MWLLKKLFTHTDQPKPRFAFQGTVNWMRGLAILVDGQFSHQQLLQFYQSTQRRQPASVRWRCHWAWSTSMCAVSEEWSGLKLVIRKGLR
jgi:hypothetical protein